MLWAFFTPFGWVTEKRWWLWALLANFLGWIVIRSLLWTILAFSSLSIISRIFFGTSLTCPSRYIEKWPLLWTLFTSSRVLVIVRRFHRTEIWWQIRWVDKILTLTLIIIRIKWRSIRTRCTLMQISIIERLFRWTKTSIICSYTFGRINRVDWLTLWAWFTCSIFCNSWPVYRTLDFHTCCFIVIELLNSRAFNTLTLCIIIISITILVTNSTSGDTILIWQLTPTLLALTSRQVDKFTLLAKYTLLCT